MKDDKNIKYDIKGFLNKNPEPRKFFWMFPLLVLIRIEEIEKTRNYLIWLRSRYPELIDCDYKQVKGGNYSDI